MAKATIKCSATCQTVGEKIVVGFYWSLPVEAVKLVLALNAEHSQKVIRMGKRYPAVPDTTTTIRVAKKQRGNEIELAPVITGRAEICLTKNGSFVEVDMDHGKVASTLCPIQAGKI